jgi:hypothetical protein
VLDCLEQCDTGAFNGAPNGTCTTQCRDAPPALRIPGGGSRKTDCALEWAVPLDASRLVVDRRGLARKRQTCVDDDPSCDFDPSAGTCRFRLFVCVGGGDARFGCAPATVSSVEVVRPRPSDGHPARAALVAALEGLGFPAGPGERCTGGVDFPVAAGTEGRVAARALLTSGKADSDTLKLRCLAAP